jgi:epoxyqueuosine reductase
MPISSEEVRAQALALGWDDVGITQATIPDADITSYRSWLEKGQHAGLTYMENDLREAPGRLLPGAKSAILCITHYKQAATPPRPDAGIIAAYARGRDYHNLHRRRLKAFIRWLEERAGVSGIAIGFSDSKPLLEKALFVQAGLGWFGKNTLLIHRRFGTFTLLSGILTTLALPSPPPIDTRIPRCGVCQRCLDACPTQALIAPYQIDAARCLAYQLIESKEAIPHEIAANNPGYAFGCDICQNVCPHNVRPPLGSCPELQPESGNGAYLTWEDIEALEKNPEKLYGSPLQRRGVAGLRHTLQTLLPPTG